MKINNNLKNEKFNQENTSSFEKSNLWMMMEFTWLLDNK